MVEGLLQPIHFIFVILMVLLLLGNGGRLPRLRRGFEELGGLIREDLRMWQSPFHLGPHAPIRCYFPEHNQGAAMENKTARPKRWLKYLAVILIGNLLYFTLMPYLPVGARHRSFHVDAGTLVDLWFCLIVFGVFELAEFLWKRRKSR